MTMQSKKLLKMGLVVGMAAFLSACGGGGDGLNEPDLSSRIYVNGCITDGTILVDGTQKRIADVKVSAQGINYNGLNFVMSDVMGNFKLPIPKSKTARVWGLQNEGQTTRKITDDVEIGASTVDLQLQACMLLKASPATLAPGVKPPVAVPETSNACLDLYHKITPRMMHADLIRAVGVPTLWLESVPGSYMWQKSIQGERCTIAVQTTYAIGAGIENYMQTQRGAIVKSVDAVGINDQMSISRTTGAWTKDATDFVTE